MTNCVMSMVDRHVIDGYGDHLALVEHRAGIRRCLTYRQLRHATEVVACRLECELKSTAGGERGAYRIAIAGVQSLETVVHWLGAMRAGGIVALLPPSPGSEACERIGSFFKPQVRLTDDVNSAASFDLMASIDQILEEPVTEHEFATRYSYWSTESSLANRPALVLSTSGSTGQPKLCVHRHGAFALFASDVTQRMWKMTREDRVLASGGPHFSFGLQGIHAPLAIGATSVLAPERGYHDRFIETIQSEAVTAFLAVPTLLHLLMLKNEPVRGALRITLSAGERLPANIRRRWEEATGSTVVDSIGTTETFSPYLSEIFGQGAGLARLGSMGYDVEPMTPSDDSLVTVKPHGGCMMLGYLAGLDRGVIITPPTDFQPGDLFSLDDRGFHFSSRTGERTKVGGQWVTPQALEEIALEVEGVAKALAMPLPTPEGLTRMRLYVVLDEGRETESRMALLGRTIRERAPSPLKPDRIEIVGEIPSTPSGKILRRQPDIIQ